jgi:hypothetical protein
MKTLLLSIAIGLISIGAVSSVVGQQVDSRHSEQTATAIIDAPQGQPGSQTPSDEYVFPTSEERTKRYVRGVIGPFALARMATSAGINQWKDHPEEWGQGTEGYGKRFASQFGRNGIRQTVQFGLSEALQLDTGFERSKRKGFGPRLRDALVQNVTSRTRSGKRVISAPILAGAYAGPIIAYETWYPDRFNYRDGLRSGTISLGTGFAINVIREFVFNW